jgi:hypothetical protein
VNIDLTAPNAPAGAPNLADASDSNVNTDNITSDNTPTFTGTGTAGETVTIYANGNPVGSATVDGNGDWSVTTSTLADGSYSVTARFTDLAGNQSGDGPALNPVVIDTGVPNAPAVTAITDDTGTNGADGITSDNQLTFSGTAEANASVEVFIDGQSIGTTNANGAGAWSYDHSGHTLADGTYQVTARATDTAGNTSAVSSNFSVTVDTSNPVAPAITGISTDTGVSSTDFITSDRTLIFNGTAEAGSSVQLFINGNPIGNAVASGNGTWSYDHQGVTLGAGTHTLTAQVTDPS